SADDSFDDYVTGVQKLGPYADYVVINVSCPNVTNMKANGDVEVLERTVAAVMKARNGMGGEYRPPVVLKIGPDNDLQQLRVIAQVALDHRVDGIIATNTTRQRPGVIGVKEEGGLSGAPLRDMALATTREMYRLTQGKMAIIGCGGIRTAEDALAFARAGASCVQVYSSMTVDGPGKAREIKDGVVRLLKGRKWADVVGEDARRNLPLAPATPTTARSSEQQHGLSALEEGVIQQHSSGYNVFEDDRVLRICDEVQATAVDAPDGVDTLGGEEAADGGSSGGHMAAAGRRWRLAQLVGGGRRRTGSSADMGHRRSNHGSASTYSSPAAGGGAESGSFDLRWQQKHRRKRMRWWKHSASASGSGSGMLAPAPSEKPGSAGSGWWSAVVRRFVRPGGVNRFGERVAGRRAEHMGFVAAFALSSVGFILWGTLVPRAVCSTAQTFTLAQVAARRFVAANGVVADFGLAQSSFGRAMHGYAGYDASAVFPLLGLLSPAYGAPHLAACVGNASAVDAFLGAWRAAPG
ncbi:dihydroorotate dehydrogenase, partial [Coemansia sp. S85]